MFVQIGDTCAPQKVYPVLCGASTIKCCYAAEGSGCPSSLFIRDWTLGPGPRPVPKLAVDIREPRPFHRTAEDGELLPKSDILESQLAASLEGRDESANKRRNYACMVPADRRLIKFGARG